jgi:DNA polymerase III alpha subunit
LPQRETADGYLAKLCWQKAHERYDPDFVGLSPEIEARIYHELNLIEKLGLSAYFLIVWDIMDYAKRSGIPAQGRGSAANSIVLGKALGMPADLLDRMTKSVSAYGAKDIEQDLASIEEFRSYFTSQNSNHPIWQEFVSLCREICDFPRHLSIHNGGMLISSCPLTDIVPLEKATMPGRIVCQWDKDSIADAGLIWTMRKSTI